MAQSVEEWRPVPTADGIYEASSLGRVRRTETQRVLTPRLDRYGYVTVMISIRGRWSPRGVHALVCAAFHGPCPPGKQAAHDDGERTRNVPDNLAWKTPLEQAADKNRHGTTVMGESCHLAKITEVEVLAIRDEVARGMTYAAIGRARDMTPENLSFIANRRTWKHV